MTNVLITGSAGFLGKHCARYFKEHQCTIYGLGNSSWNRDEFSDLGFKQWISGDIIIENLLRIETIPDIIIHCAGSGSVLFSTQEPYKDFHKTVIGTINLLEYIRKYAQDTRLIYPSSTAVYGNHEPTPIKISDILLPISPYGLHKKIAEELCIEYTKLFAIKTTIIRFFSIYGPGLKKQIFWDACNKLHKNNVIAKFYGTGEQIRDFLYIDDAVDLIYKTAFAESPHHILNGGTGTGLTINQVLSKVKEIIHSNAAIVYNNYENAFEPKYYIADITEAITLGWKPMYSINEGLNKYIIWYLQEINDKPLLSA